MAEVVHFFPEIARDVTFGENIVESVEYGEEADFLALHFLALHFLENEMEKIGKAFIFQFQILSKVRLHWLEGFFDPFRETLAELVICPRGVTPVEVPVQGDDIVITCIFEVGSKVVQEYRLSERRRAYDAYIMLGQAVT